MSNKKRYSSQSKKGEFQISGFWIPKPDVDKSLKEYPKRKENMDSYASRLDLNKQVSKEVLDTEFKI